MMRYPPRAIADAFLAGDLVVDQLVARATHALNGNWRWLRPVALRYVEAFAGRTRPRFREVYDFLKQDPGLRRAWAKHGEKITVQTWMFPPQRMQPVAAAVRWEIPVIESEPALAEWLGVTPGELEWFADLASLTSRNVRRQLQHYRYTIVLKTNGGIRLIEAPKPRLKEIQRRILEGILNQVPLHPATHGFARGRSIKTFAAPHAGQSVILKMDLRQFFPSISGVRIQTVFRTLGYPERVADLLGGLCTTACPLSVWKGCSNDPKPILEARALYARPHLPQGAPTSPALANICAYRFDQRLMGLAQKLGAEYTRYADDMAFSGTVNFERSLKRFPIHVAAILSEEGFEVNHRKTRVMRQGVRQRLVGLTVNQRPNVAREDFDRLKAILTNCARLGIGSQNREGHTDFRAHLEGRVGFVESIHPHKAQRLRAIIDRIA